MARALHPVEAGVTIGQVFLGKYRVDAIIGHGGMGVVAECTHLALNERVAIKMLRQDVMLDQDAVQRFIREAQAAVKLKSEHVARVSDVGTFENDVPYMVMEFLEGHDLGKLLEQRGTLPVAWASELMMQTAEALAEAHALGIVHRDVKPTNLFVTWRPDGTALVKVLDFGISKSPMGADMQLTQTQSLLGTPAYMSPEQMRSARLVDSRSDIWSLGTVFYELLEGRRPFEAESFSEMCVKVAVDAPSPMVNTPPALQHVILKCLAKTPEQRYGNMAELGRDLIPFTANLHQSQMLVERMTRVLRRGPGSWDGDSAMSAPALPAVAQWSVGSEPVGTPWQATSEPHAARFKTPLPTLDGSEPFVKQEYATTLLSAPRHRRWLVWSGAIVVLAGLGIGLGVLLSGSPRPAPEVVTTPRPPATIELPAVATQPTAGSAQIASDPKGSATGSAEPPVVVSPPPPPTTPTVIRPHPTSTAGTRPKSVPVKVPVKDPKDVKEPNAPAKEKCDPFKAMHGCVDAPTAHPAIDK